MANIREWSESDLTIIENKIKSIDVLSQKLIEIERILIGLPKKAKPGDYLGAIKWWLYCKKRRVRIQIANQTESHSFAQELELIRSKNGICAYCGDSSNPTIDHIVPVSKGGHNGMSNLQVLCGRCNSSKGGRHG